MIGRHTIRETDVYSACAAVQNLWLAARAEGIGVGWVSILQPEFLRAVLKIPEAIVPVAYLCVGYVREFPPRPQLETAGWLPRVPLEQLVFGEQFGQSAPPELQDALHGQETQPLSLAQAAGKRPKGKGLVVLYTGEGKGKTTAALGLMARCLGRGYPVGVVQFIKGKWKTGERLFAESHPRLTFHVMGRGFTWESDDLEQDRRAAAAAWQQSKEMIRSGDYFVVILDEITYAVNYSFIELAGRAGHAQKPPGRPARGAHRPRRPAGADRSVRHGFRDAQAQASVRPGDQGPDGHRFLKACSFHAPCTDRCRLFHPTGNQVRAG